MASLSDLEGVKLEAKPSRLMVGAVIFQVLTLSAACLAIAVMLAGFSRREAASDEQIELLGGCLIAQFAEHRAAQYAGHRAIAGALNTDYEHSFDASIPNRDGYDLGVCRRYLGRSGLQSPRPTPPASPSPSPSASPSADAPEPPP
jgi:hypothetical protein